MFKGSSNRSAICIYQPGRFDLDPQGVEDDGRLLVGGEGYTHVHLHLLLLVKLLKHSFSTNLPPKKFELTIYK